MKHLILGSEGQIGGHLKKVLLEKGEEVLEFDIIRSEAEDLRIHRNKLLTEKMSEADFIHFLAFDVGGSGYMQKYQDTYNFVSNNTKILDNVFSEIQKQRKPFIFASSQMANMMHSTYGILKMIGEKYTNSLGGMVVKFWNVYGYEKIPDKAHVITDFIKMAEINRKIVMRTNGEEERQFLYGDDAAECLFNLSKQYTVINKTMPLHVTNFQWTKVIDIAKIIGSFYNDCEIIPAEMHDTLQKGFKNEPDKFVLNYWKPVTALKDGIHKTIELLKDK